MSRSIAGTVVKVLTAIAVLFGISAYVWGVWPFAGQLQQAAEAQGKALIGGPFSLVDHNGNRVTEAAFAGRVKLMYFGYSYCPDMCPLGLATIAAAYDQLAPQERERVVPIFVTVDPERDTVAALADYVGLFHPALVGLTGTIDEVTAAAGAYRIYFRKAESESSTEYLVDHSTFTYLMDGNNEYVTHFGHDTTPEAVVEAVRRHLAATAGS